MKKFRTLRNPIFLSSLKLLEMILYRPNYKMIARKSKKKKVQKKKIQKNGEKSSWYEDPIHRRCNPSSEIQKSTQKHNFKATPHQNSLSPRNLSAQYNI